jgi:hypothetical protein
LITFAIVSSDFAGAARFVTALASVDPIGFFFFFLTLLLLELGIINF